MIVTVLFSGRSVGCEMPASETLRRARVSVPVRAASAAAETCTGSSSSVAVCPIATLAPFFFSMLGPMARTRIFSSRVWLV
jgi:hypothetical protein